MKITIPIRRFTISLALLVFCASATAQDVVVVANLGVGVSAIKDADLRAIFLGEKTRLPDGSRVLPVMLRGGPAHEIFLENRLGKSPDEFRAQWRRAVFTGQGAMPKSFDSEAAVLEYVAATPGALGYVSHVSPQDNVKRIHPER
jgi:ABC-type phosphate transport system substrate-binding protein